jgi:hypothetical protein
LQADDASEQLDLLNFGDNSTQAKKMLLAKKCFTRCQGDQFGRPFTNWVIVYFYLVLKVTEVSQLFGILFPL